MIRKIINPFTKMDLGKNYHCFGCSPENKIGLKLEFEDKDGVLEAQFLPQKIYEGYFDVLHGGIQATLHDEIASWMVYTQCGTAGVTISLEVKYRNPVIIDGNKITIRARLVEQTSRIAKFETEIVDKDQKVCSTANVSYRLFSEELSKSRLKYPGKERFFEEE